MHPREIFRPFHTLICIFSFTRRIDRRFRALHSFSSPNILFIQQPFNRKVNRQPWCAGWVCRAVAILVWFGYKRFNAERYTSSRGRPALLHCFICLFVNKSQFCLLAQNVCALARESLECLVALPSLALVPNWREPAVSSHFTRLTSAYIGPCLIGHKIIVSLSSKFVVDKWQPTTGRAGCHL